MTIGGPFRTRAAAAPGFLVAGARVRLMGRRCRRQAAHGREMSVLLGNAEPRIRKNVEWLRTADAPWGGVLRSCDMNRVFGMAKNIGIDAHAAGVREVFLWAMSTVDTYVEAWDMLLESSSGSTRKTLLDIHRLEDEVNALNRNAFHGADYYFRGLSVEEARAVSDGSVGPGPVYKFVSMSTILPRATVFVLDQYEATGMGHVILVVDAHLARGMGAKPALYSTASAVLDLSPTEESVQRAFPITLAREMQVHFETQWPKGASEALAAVITPSGLSPAERAALAATGVMCVRVGSV